MTSPAPGTRAEKLAATLGRAVNPRGLLPTPLFDAYFAMMAARATMAGVSLGVFELLGTRAATSEEVAEELALEAPGVDVLLVALHSLELLTLEDGRYVNAPVADRYLRRSSPRSQADLIGGFAFETDLGSGYDVVTVHLFLHNLTPGHRLHVLGRGRDALSPGGRLAVLELERPPDGARGTRVGSLTSLLFYAAARTRCLTADEVAGLMREAGLRDVAIRRPRQLLESFVAVGRR